MSFEHVPPRSAFNNRPVIYLDKDLVLKGSLDTTKGKTQQRGSGEFTLCELCNNNTGRWYANEYAKWVLQGMEALSLLRPGLAGDKRFIFCPLNAFKQIVCMMCSVNPTGLSEQNPEIRRFLLNPKSRDWNPKFQIYMNFNIANRMRFSGTQGILRKGQSASIVSEITYPPFGFLMTHDSYVPSQDLVNINFFCESLYNELREIWLLLPVVNPYTAFPADYRSKNEVLKTAGNS